MTTNQHQWRYTTAHHPAQALPRTHGVVVALRDRGAIKRVGLDDVGTSHEVLLVDASDDVRLRQIEDVVVASQVRVMVCEPFAAVVLLHKLVLLDHGAHGAIDDEDPLRQLRAQVRLQVSGAPHIGIHVDRLAVFSSHLAYSRAQGQCTDTVSTEKSRLCCCNVRQPCDENAANCRASTAVEIAARVAVRGAFVIDSVMHHHRKMEMYFTNHHDESHRYLCRVTRGFSPHHPELPCLRCLRWPASVVVAPHPEVRVRCLPRSYAGRPPPSRPWHACAAYVWPSRTASPRWSLPQILCCVPQTCKPPPPLPSAFPFSPSPRPCITP